MWLSVIAVVVMMIYWFDKRMMNEMAKLPCDLVRASPMFLLSYILSFKSPVYAVLTLVYFLCDIFFYSYVL